MTRLFTAASFGTRFTLCASALAALVISGCSRAGGAIDAAAETRAIESPDLFSDEATEPVRRLEQMRSAGQFDEFVESALAAASENPHDATLLLLGCDTLLAVGRNQAAEDSARRAALLATERSQPAWAAQAIKLWTLARFRQGLSVDAPDLTPVLAQLAAEEPAVSMLRFWQEALGGRAPYRFVESAASAAPLPLAVATTESLPYELAAVQARVNGTRLPLVFIDTGGQHTLLTSAAAQAAGVRLGAAPTQLTGFVGLSARAGLIETLELGELVLHDVPVLVGDSPPLVAAHGQMSLGTDLMHHVRFAIDYPARQVTAQPIHTPSTHPSIEPCWSIPVWTFPQICLARGQLPGGNAARVLIDTGDRAGTFVSYHWARRNLPQLAGPTTSMVFRYKKRNLTLDQLRLGSGTLTNWPVVDTIPTELDRLQVVDIMLGRDLLAPYRLTIDLPARVLELRPGANPPAELGAPGAQHDLP